jgi:preprotein translocase subunit SecE
MRRLQAKEEERAKKRRQQGPRRKKQRTSPRQFIREVRQELKKVAWPTRQETTTFTTVVVITTTVITGVIFVFDFFVKRAVFSLLGG